MREWLRNLVNVLKSNPREAIIETGIVVVATVLTVWVVWFVFAGDAPDPELPLGPSNDLVVELDSGTLTQVDLPEQGLRCWTLEPRGVKSLYSSPGLSCAPLATVEQCPDVCYTPLGMLREYARLQRLSQELQSAEPNNQSTD